MKNKTILYLTIFLFYNFHVNSQEYHQLLDHESEWHLTSCSSTCINDVYYTNGDTTYNGYQYKILNGYHYISRTFWLREDVSEKHIFLSYDNGKSRIEVLLYDFSLQIGDTILLSNPITPFPSNGGFYKVDSIVSQNLLDNKSHNFFYLSPTASNQSSDELPVWIEGIGGLTLINGPGGTPDINRVGKISCYFNDGFLSYSQLDSLDRCTVKYVTGLKEIQRHSNRIYPTIFESILRLEDVSEVSEVVIYSLRGEEVYRRKLNHQSYKNLELSHLEKGLYVIRLYDNNLPVVSKKIVKL